VGMARADQGRQKGKAWPSFDALRWSAPVFGDPWCALLQVASSRSSTCRHHARGCHPGPLIMSTGGDARGERGAVRAGALTRGATAIRLLKCTRLSGTTPRDDLPHHPAPCDRLRSDGRPVRPHAGFACLSPQWPLGRTIIASTSPLHIGSGVLTAAFSSGAARVQGHVEDGLRQRGRHSARSAMRSAPRSTAGFRGRCRGAPTRQGEFTGSTCDRSDPTVACPQVSAESCSGGGVEGHRARTPLDWT